MDDNTMAVVVTTVLASGVVLSLFAFHVGRALADRIRGPLRTAAGEDMKALREELTGELHQLRSEIGELAERLDFAERLLAKERDAARLGRPGGG